MYPFCNSIPACKLLNQIFDRMALKHTTCKFIKIVATKCVENFQDRDCPAVIVYKDGKPVKQMIPALRFFMESRMNYDIVEYVMAEAGIVETEQEYDPRDKMKMMNIVIAKGKDAGRGMDGLDDIDRDAGDDREYTNN